MEIKVMTEADALDAAISDAYIEYSNALIVFVGPDGLTRVLGWDV